MQKTRECLLIDDDLDDHEIFKMCIQQISGNISCKTMSDAPEAIALLTDTDYTPDFIFVDVNMPKMSGIECLRALKGISRLANTKIFMYSTTSENSFLAETKKLGADDFIIKPSKTAELKIKLSKIFETGSEINNKHNPGK